MKSVDTLWFQSTQATQAAEQAYHRLLDRFDPDVEFERTRRVPKHRYRMLVERINRSGTPYGAHTIVRRPDGSILLVRHEGVDLWVLPGGEVGDRESIRAGAERELAEEAGIDAAYEGLAIMTTVHLRCGEYETKGVLPVFSAKATATETTVADPDGEISAAKWFDTLPPDTRDRDDLLAWLSTIGDV